MLLVEKVDPFESLNQKISAHIKLNDQIKKREREKKERHNVLSLYLLLFSL
jgi:hypothetical protein